ncbi:MAG: DUF3892 domain-containing protein [Kordiimonas sp.]
MANSHEILFVRRNLSNQSTTGITHIGGRLKEGAEWSIPSEEAIKGIQSGRFEFYIHNDAGEVEKLVVARHRRHGTYLKAEHDNVQPQKLLNLPEGLTD